VRSRTGPAFRRQDVPVSSREDRGEDRIDRRAKPLAGDVLAVIFGRRLKIEALIDAAVKLDETSGEAPRLVKSCK
jgi:hypothetical protein